MQGVRRPDGTRAHEMVSGEYAFPDPERRDQVEFVDPYGNIGTVRNIWEVTIHEDETVTISPSILDNSGGPTAWHGFLIRGVWTW